MLLDPRVIRKRYGYEVKGPTESTEKTLQRPSTQPAGGGGVGGWTEVDDNHDQVVWERERKREKERERESACVFVRT